MDDLPERALAALERYGGWEGVLAALKDAERYRWLRKHHDARIYEAGGFYRVEKYSLSWEESIDAAIDAAMAGPNG